MELLFGYLAGVLTLINPCVLPVLPIALASSLHADKRGPLLLALGMSVTFVGLGLSIATMGPAIGLGEEEVARAGAVLMMVFGTFLLIPAFSERFALATAGLSSRADASMGALEGAGLRNQFLGGVLLGAVWSPCIGPTLGGAISLASQGSSLVWAGLIMTSFALGISTIILALAYGARESIRKRQESLRGLAEKSKPIMGAVFLGVGLMILFELHKYAEIWLLEIMPIWLQDLSVVL